MLTSYKSSIVLDLKKSECIAFLKSMLSKVDVLIDPFRPGVLENLGLCPKTLVKEYPRLIVLRLTGFRRDGKYKDLAGHDINYLAVSGLLNQLGASGSPPSPPANILGDYAGGGLVGFVGVLLAIMHRSMTGNGQVVEANMVDGVSYLGTIPRLRTKEPVWNGERGTNLLDGGCPYYRCYECKDTGQYMSVGALEPKFFTNLLLGLELDTKKLGFSSSTREDKNTWPRMHQLFDERFRQKTRSEWEAIFDGLDACVTPVLEYAELERAHYEQRPLVHLQESPAKPVKAPWKGKILKLGDGGIEALSKWYGLEEGKDFELDDQGVLIYSKRSKL